MSGKKCVIFVLFVVSLLLLIGCQKAVEQDTADTAKVVNNTVTKPEMVVSSVSKTNQTTEDPTTAAVTKPKCGDGKCDSNENCDKCYKDCACKSPAECYQGACKVPDCGSANDCNDKNNCTVDTCEFAQHPNAYCLHDAIDECKNSDKCCPSGCNAETDTDCKSVCGNNICEVGEASDSCEKDCAGDTCGNGVCDEGETPNNCDSDCEDPTRCGNGDCETGEDKLNCPADC